MYVLQRVVVTTTGPSIFIVFAVSTETDKLKAWVENNYPDKPQWRQHNYGLDSSVGGSESHYWVIHLINDLDNR